MHTRARTHVGLFSEPVGIPAIGAYHTHSCTLDLLNVSGYFSFIFSPTTCWLNNNIHRLFGIPDNGERLPSVDYEIRTIDLWCVKSSI